MSDSGAGRRVWRLSAVSRVLPQPGETTHAPVLARIGRMGALFMASNLARGAAAFATSLVIARALGPDVFGRWTLCITWAGMLTFLLDLGFGVLLTRDAAARTAAPGALVSRALAVRMTLFVPVAIVFLAAAPALGLRDVTPGLLWSVLLLAAAGIAYGSIAAVFRAWPTTLAAIVIVEVAGAVVQLAGTWALARQNSDVTALLLLASAVQIAQLGAASFLWPRVSGEPHVVEWPSVALGAAMLRRALPFAVAGLIVNLQERLAPLMLGRLSGVVEVALFGAAWRIGSAVRMVPQAMFGGALPVLSAAGGREESEHAVTRFDRLLNISAAVVAGTLALLAGPILRLTYGSEYAGGASTLMWVAIGLWPFLVNSGRRVSLYAAGRERDAVRWSGVALVVQVVGCTILIPRLGAAGAALAMAAGEIAVWWPLRAIALRPGNRT